MDISRVSLKFFVKIYFRLYERGVSPPLHHLANYYPRSHLEGLQLFHINVLKTAGPTRQHLSRPAFFWIRFTSSVSLYVGYKLKTCTQISHCEFSRRKIDVVSLLDSSKRASPGRMAGFSHGNAKWNPALLLGLALPWRLSLLHIITPLILWNNHMIWYPISTCQIRDYLDNEIRSWENKTLFLSISKLYSSQIKIG